MSQSPHNCYCFLHVLIIHVSTPLLIALLPYPFSNFCPLKLIKHYFSRMNISTFDYYNPSLFIFVLFMLNSTNFIPNNVFRLILGKLICILLKFHFIYTNYMVQKRDHCTNLWGMQQPLYQLQLLLFTLLCIPSFKHFTKVSHVQ